MRKLQMNIGAASLPSPPRWLRELSRADFLRSVGLYITRDHVVLARLRKNLQRVALLQEEKRELAAAEGRQAISELTGWIAEDVREIALKAEGDSRERALRQALLSLLPHFSAGKDSLYICVPEDQAIVQPILLPRVAEENLRQVLEYEIERQLPFPRDEVFYDFLPLGRRGDRFAVYLFAIPKKNLSTTLEVLGSFGIVPDGVETTTTALANYLTFCNPEATGAFAVIGGLDGGCQMVGLRADPGAWQPTRRITFSHRLPDADWSRAVGRELLRECLDPSVKLYRWGSTAALLSEFVENPPPQEDLVAAGNRRLTGGKPIRDPDAVPAVGAALRGVREATFGVNVVGGEGARQRGASRFSLLNGALAGLLALACLAWGVSYPIKDELRVRQLQKENRRLQPAVDALRREEKQLEQARKELELFADIDRRKGEVLRVLDELSRVVPTNAYLSNLRYRAGSLEIQGNAENASSLIPVLEKSALFENVGFNAPSNRGRDNRETFSLKAELEKPKGQVRKP
ncbi:MAG TPA: PilN domain-containing protein [candidate division Zixibacteria bacterium]|nr:PilN domain-containing protein [candidate division Zixibacteria bacterium]